jgi:hypothetical protein
MRLFVASLLLLVALPVWAQDAGQPAASEADKMCPGGIEPMIKLVSVNPYDSEGRCFRYMGRLVYLLNKSQGIYSAMSDSAPFALVDFGKASAPMNFYSGVVIGKGAYTYETALGGQEIVFSFSSIPQKTKAAAPVPIK